MYIEFFFQIWNIYFAFSQLRVKWQKKDFQGYRGKAPGPPLNPPLPFTQMGSGNPNLPKISRLYERWKIQNFAMQFHKRLNSLIHLHNITSQVSLIPILLGFKKKNYMINTINIIYFYLIINSKKKKKFNFEISAGYRCWRSHEPP